jgi:transcriptional regulator GlxA family with amidase domain
MVVYPDVQIVDATGPLEVFARTARWLMDQGRRREPAYTVELLAARRGPVRCSSGLELVVRRSFMEVGGGIDTLLVAGGIGAPRALGDRALVRWLRQIVPRVRRLGSVCTGACAFLLAEAGLLDGRRATTHWRACRELADRYPRVASMLTRSSSVTGASTPRPVSRLGWISRSPWSRRTMDARSPRAWPDSS